MKGTELARDAAGGHNVHADIIDSFKEQMLLALIKKLGGHASLTVAEIDDTGGDVMSLQLVDTPAGKAFVFKVEKKQ